MEKSGYKEDTRFRYYNIKITNLQNILIQATYNETRTTNIIEDSLANWEVTVARFRIPSNTIPIFVFQDNTYYVTLVDTTGVTHTQVLQYVPITNVVAPPPISINRYITSYNQWVDIVNNGLNAVWLSIPVLNRPSAPPFVLYDSLTQLFSIYATNEYASFFNEPGKTQLWFNSYLTGKFDASTFQGFYQQVSNPLFFNVYIKANGSNQITAGPTTFLNCAPAVAGITYFQMTQEFKSLYSLSDFDTLLLKCSKLPVVSEYTSSATGSSDQFINMMTDFEPTFDNLFNNHSDLQYNPSVYRWTSMYSNANLREMDLSIFWRAIDGTITPVFLYPNKQLTVKLEFRKKPPIDKKV
jgi:hypothetical protein